MKLTVNCVEKRIASPDPFEKSINSVYNQGANLLTKELKKRLANAVCGAHLEKTKGTYEEDWNEDKKKQVRWIYNFDNYACPCTCSIYSCFYEIEAKRR